jgi:hypothetical protein
MLNILEEYMCVYVCVSTKRHTGQREKGVNEDAGKNQLNGNDDNNNNQEKNCVLCHKFFMHAYYSHS